MIILSIEEARKQDDFYEYQDGVYQYAKTDGYHLIINGKDVLEGLNAMDCDYYGDGVYKYQIPHKWHLIINDKDVLADVRAIDCGYGGDGKYKYKTEDYEIHEGKVELNKKQVATKKTPKNTQKTPTKTIETFVEYMPQANRTMSLNFYMNIKPELLHGIIGLCTEVGEMRQALVVVDSTNQFDTVNFAEEIGDCLWYLAACFEYSSANPKHIEFKGSIAQYIDLDDIEDYTNQLEIVTSDLLDMAKKSLYYNRHIKELDFINALVTTGKLLNKMASSIGVPLGGIAQINIDKLKERFPDKFTEHHASNRDLNAERAVLELVKK